MAQAAQITLTASPPAPPARKVRLLLADDDDASRAAIGYILGSAGFEITQACNGKEAVAQAARGGFDLLLMDLEMPVMDGVRALALIKHDPATRQTPVIMLTRFASRDNVKKCVELGASDFITKQALRIENVIAKINHVLAEKARKAAAAAAGQAGAQAGKTTAPAPADPRAWSDKVQAIGPIDREKTKAALHAAVPPAIFPKVRDDVRAILGGAGELDEVVGLILQDPALTAAVLGQAHRPPTGKPEQDCNVGAAVNALGQAGLSEAMARLPAGAGQISPDVRPWLANWWRHAVAVSQVAGELAAAVNVAPPLARAAGFLHDIGRLVLLSSALAPKAITAYDLARNTIFPTTHSEETLLGVNHKQVGQDFCARHKLPAAIGEICQTHDLDDVMRDRLDEQPRMVSAVVCAANQIAKAAGFGSLPNDEIGGLPARVLPACEGLGLQIKQAISQVETLCLWRMGKSGAEAFSEGANLGGRSIVLISPDGGPWNPLRCVLVRAGADVTSFSKIKEVLDAPPAADLMIIDHSGTSINLAMPMLRRLNLSGRFKEMPRLLLARRFEEPESRISQANLAMSVYPTPLRALTLLQAAKRLLK